MHFCYWLLFKFKSPNLSEHWFIIKETEILCMDWWYRIVFQICLRSQQYVAWVIFLSIACWYLLSRIQSGQENDSSRKETMHVTCNYCLGFKFFEEEGLVGNALEKAGFYFWCLCPCRHISNKKCELVVRLVKPWIPLKSSHPLCKRFTHTVLRE